jgi:hypothetical protein
MAAEINPISFKQEIVDLGCNDLHQRPVQLELYYVGHHKRDYNDQRHVQQPKNYRHVFLPQLFTKTLGITPQGLFVPRVARLGICSIYWELIPPIVKETVLIIVDGRASVLVS